MRDSIKESISGGSKMAGSGSGSGGLDEREEREEDEGGNNDGLIEGKYR